MPGRMPTSDLPMRFPVSRLLLTLLLCLALCGCARTPFEKEHDRAAARNPRWLSIELDTLDKRRQYRESDLITFVSRYSSSVPYQYKMEMSDDNPNSADWLHVSLNKPTDFSHAFTCCYSQIAGISEDPLEVGRLYVKLKPGRHEIWVSTRRVYPWSAPSQNYEKNDWICASNLLKVTVVPDHQ